MYRSNMSAIWAYGNWCDPVFRANLLISKTKQTLCVWHTMGLQQHDLWVWRMKNKHKQLGFWDPPWGEGGQSYLAGFHAPNSCLFISTSRHYESTIAWKVQRVNIQLVANKCVLQCLLFNVPDFYCLILCACGKIFTIGAEANRPNIQIPVLRVLICECTIYKKSVELDIRCHRYETINIRKRL